MPAYAFMSGVRRSVPAPPWVNVGGGLRQCEQGYVLTGGAWHPIWELIQYPLYQYAWVKVGGRSGGVPGTLWGSTHGYAAYSFTRYRNITAVQIRISIKKKQGSFHGSGGDWAAGGSPVVDPGSGGSNTGYQWRAAAHTGEQVSPWLPCNVAPSQELRLFGKGNGDRGDGKTYNWIRIEGLQFA